MVCKNLCERLYSKMVFGGSYYEGDKKYCRRCEVYYYQNGMFCACCGMALRVSPTNQRDKERLRQLQLKREKEQDKIIRIIKRNKEVPSQSRQSQNKILHNYRSILAIIHDGISASAGLHRWL